MTDYTLFEARPGVCALLLPDAPKYTILTVSDDFVRTTGIKREALIGYGLFEKFPESPEDTHFTGKQNVSDSFQQVMARKEPHLLPVQRYDIPNGDGTFTERYWRVYNLPVLNDKGDVRYIVHTSDEITAQVKAEQREVAFKDIEKAFDLFMQAPVAVCIVKGADYVVELANEEMLQFLGRTQVMVGKPIIDSLPEARLQGLIGILDEVRTTGAPYYVPNFPAILLINGVHEQRYFNLVFKPFFQSPDETVPTGIFCIAHNVTKQILYQKEIEEREHRFRTLIEEATVATGLYLGTELRIQYANNIMLGYWGKGASVVGMPLSQAVPELKGQSFLGLLNDVYATGKPYIGVEEEAYLKVNGKLQSFYFDFTYKPLRDTQGKIYGIHHTAIDVTQEVLAKKKLEAAEQKARLAIESADLGTYEIDLTTDEMVTSSRFQAIWGVSNTTDRGAFARAIHPDDLAQREAAHSESNKTGNLHYEARLLTGKENVKWVRVRGKVLFNQQHEPQRLLGVVQDITEQKQFAEELKRQVRQQTEELVNAHTSLVKTNAYFQQIINKFVTAFVSLTPVFDGDRIIDFRFKMTNAAYSNYSNLTPEAIKNKAVSEVFPEYFKTDAFERYTTVYKTGMPQIWDLHYNVDSLNVYLEVNASKMNDEVLVHFTDFTALKSLQFDLVRKVEELERSNQNLEEFAYAASHDMKEPIRKILFFGDRLKLQLKEQLNEEQTRLFDRMEHAARRMNILIEDLLTYSHVSRGISHIENVDLNLKVKNVLEDLELEIEEKHAKVRVADLPVIKGQKRQIQQLFQNLISNALKYSHPNSPPEIYIGSKLTSGLEANVPLKAEVPNDTYYLIEIKDNGIGFNQQDAERIFNVFTRLHGNLEYRGSGVGLSIARKVAENHNGYIWAESELGKGATFKVMLPVKNQSD